jgi:DNA-binding MarR family transcriptional regulator
MTDTRDLALAEQLLRIVLGLRRVVRRRVRSEPGLALRGAQIELLRVVEEQPGIGVAAAAQELHLAGNSVSTLVNQLIDARMLRREVDPLDRRAARLELTESATQQLDNWRRARTGLVAGALATLSEKDSTAITGALPALDRLMEIVKEQPERQRVHEDSWRDLERLRRGPARER